MTNVLESVLDCYLIIRDKHTADVIYVYYSRDFDSTVHRKLLTGLYKLGIHGELLHWISDCLTNRIQDVVIQNYVFLLVNLQFLSKMLNPSSCLSHLIPEMLDEIVLGQLKNAQSYPVPFARTQKFKKSFIVYAFSKFQNIL